MRSRSSPRRARAAPPPGTRTSGSKSSTAQFRRASRCREPVSSPACTGAGLTRFWLRNHDLTFAQGGPDWCQREDRSEREFSIPIDPGLAIVSAFRRAGHHRPALYRDTRDEAGRQADLAHRPRRAGDLVPAVGSASARRHPLDSWRFERNTHLRGELPVRREGRERQPLGHGDVHNRRSRTLTVRSPLGAVQRPSGEVGIRFGRTVPQRAEAAPTMGACVGGIAGRRRTRFTRRSIIGALQTAAAFAVTLAATAIEGRVAKASSVLTVAPRLAIKTARLQSPIWRAVTA